VGYGVNQWPILWGLGRPQDEQGEIALMGLPDKNVSK